MRPLWPLLIALLCAGCPRTSNTTLPRPKPAPVAAPLPKLQVQAKTEAVAIQPPVNYLALGSAMSASPLPADVLSQFPQAKLSADRSQLESRSASGELDWLQAFTTPANDEELLRYYEGILGVKGFTKAESDSKGEQARRFDHRWNSADERYQVRVFSASGKRAPALYLIHVRVLSENPNSAGIQ